MRRNPLIADFLHRISFIEKAGTGIRRMREEARKHKCPEPQFTANGFFTATFWPTTDRVHEATVEAGTKFKPKAEQDPAQVPHKYRTGTAQVALLLEAAREPRTRGELQAVSGLKHRQHFLKTYLEPLVAAKWLEMTIPDKPRSSKQRYKTADLGLKVLRQREGEQ